MQEINFRVDYSNLKVGDTVAVTEFVRVTYGWGVLNYALSKSFEIHLKVEKVTKTQFIAGGKRFMFNKCGDSFANGYGNNKLTATAPKLALSQDSELLEHQVFIDELHAANIHAVDVNLMKAKSVEAARAAIELGNQIAELREQMQSLVFDGDD